MKIIRNIKPPLIILFPALFLTFCSHDGDEHFLKSFNKEESITLVSEVFNAPFSKNLNYPYSFHKRGNLMIFSELGAYSMYLYDYSNGKFYPFAKKGRGPGELVLGAESQGWLNDSTIYCFGDQTRVLYLYRVSDLINGIIEPHTIIKFQDQTLSNQVLLPDTTRIGINRLNITGLIGYCNKNGSYNYLSEYPVDINKNISPLVRHLAYQGDFIISPNSSIVCYSSRYAAILLIAKIANSRLDQILYKKYWLPEYSPYIKGSVVSALPDSKKSRYGFLSSAIGNDHIYLLYSGRYRINNDNGSKPGYCSDLVLVYDHSGNPIKMIKLDKNICRIGVTPEENIIIGFTNFPENQIYQFKF